MLYFLCTENMNTIGDAKSMLQAFTNQIVQKKPEVCALIEQYITGPSSLAQVRKLLPIVLGSLTNVRVVVDGVDGCHEKEQDKCLKELVSLSRCRGVKVLIATQDISSIGNHLASRSSLDLTEQRIPIEMAISSFVRAKLDRIPALTFADSTTRQRVESTLMQKADGGSSNL